VSDDRKQLPGREPVGDREHEGEEQEHGGGLLDGPQGLFRRAQAMRHQQRRVQRKAERGAHGGAKIPTSGGAAIDGGLRARMEPQLGADLSHVRVHTGGESARAAETLGARAFTTGSDVHFGASEYAPGTKEGDRLIAHELTHAVQAERSGVQRKAADHTHDADAAQEHDVSQPGEPAEQEADAVADAAADNLHGGGGKKVERAGQQAAPAIGAKLDGRKIFRAGGKPLKGNKKDEIGAGPEASAVHVGNAVQAGVQAPPQHHVFPQNDTDKAWFLERGVNVHDYCVTLPVDHHEAIHAKPPKGAKGKAAEEAKKWEWNNAVMKLLKDAEKARGKKLNAKDMVTLVQPLMAQYGFSGPFEKYKGDK